LIGAGIDLEHDVTITQTPDGGPCCAGSCGHGETGNYGGDRTHHRTVMANSTVQVNARIQGNDQGPISRRPNAWKTGDVMFQIDSPPLSSIYDNAWLRLPRQGQGGSLHAVVGGERRRGQQLDELPRPSIWKPRRRWNPARLNVEFTTIRAPVNGKTGPILISRAIW